MKQPCSLILSLIAVAAAKPLHDLAVDHDGAAGIAVAFGVVGDGGVPHGLARTRIERGQVGIGGRDKHLVLINGEIAHGAGAAALRSSRPDAVLPDQLAGAGIERLNDVVGIRQIDNAVVHQRRGLVAPRCLVHRPNPGEAQVMYVLARDLGQRAVIPCLIIAADHQPVAGIGVAEHFVGDRDVVLHLPANRNTRRRTGWAGSTGCRRGRFGGRFLRSRRGISPLASSPIPIAVVAMSGFVPGRAPLD